MKNPAHKGKKAQSPTQLTRRQILTCVCIMAIPFLTACTALQADPAVEGGHIVTYICKDEALVEVRYFNLDDKSLHFVKISLPDGSTHTLPQVLSASGARYTDDGLITWWAKGDGGFVEMRDENGLWQILHADCKRISPERK